MITTSLGPYIHRSLGRRGFSFAEILIATMILGALASYLVGGSQASLRTAEDADRRLVLELRARRWQAEVLATTWETALSTAGGEFPMTLTEPTEAPGYEAHVMDLDESTRVELVSEGLMSVITRIGWTEGPMKTARSLTVTRLVARPTGSLVTREPLMAHE